MNWPCAYTSNLWLLVVLALGGSWLTTGVLADEYETRAAIEELHRQVQEQNQQIDQLRNELARQDEQIRRLPEITDSDDDRAPTPAGSEAVTADDAKSAEEDKSFSSRIDHLEQVVSKLGQEKNQFLESPSVDSSRVMNGRIHIDQWAFPDSSPGVNQIETGNPASSPLDRLVYRRLRIGIGGSVPPGNMSYRLEIDFSGQDGSQFRDAWIGWDDLALFHTVRLGNQKRPYGLDHLNSSNFNLFMERPFIVDALNEGNRRFGAVSYGTTDNLHFNWRLGVYDMDLIQNTGTSINNKYPLELAGRLANTYWYDQQSHGRGYGHVALSGTCAFPDSEPPETGASESRARFRTRPEGRSTNRWLDTNLIDGSDAYQILGIESVFNVGRFQCGGEFMNLWVQRRQQYGPGMYMHGGYVYLSYFLTGEHIPWNRRLGILGRVKPIEDFYSRRGCGRCIARGTGAWNVAVRFSYADLTDQGIYGGVGQSATFALNWYWNSHARLQGNYILGHINDRQTASGVNPIVSGNYQITGVRAIIDF